MKNEILIDQEDLNLKQIAEENNIEYSESDEEVLLTVLTVMSSKSP